MTYKAKTRNVIRDTAKKHGWEHERAWDVFRPGDTFKDPASHDRVFIEYRHKSGRVHRASFTVNGFDWFDCMPYDKHKKKFARYLLTCSKEERREIAKHRKLDGGAA